MRSLLSRAFRVLADSVSPLVCNAGARAGWTGSDGSRGGASAKRNSAGRVPFFEPLEERALMSTTYYVSPSGNDSNSGTSISSPWKSVGKVSGAHLNAGDHVLFQGGQRFSGTLSLYNENGSSSAPIVIGSYGSGQATISSGTGRGAYLLNDDYVTVENLTFVGTPGDTHSQDGIRIENYSANTTRSGITVNACNISGYAEGGIIFGADFASSGLNDVTLSNNDIYNNVMTGIESYAITTTASIASESNKNILISYNQVHNNYGDGKSNNTGDGIMLQGLNGATVEYNSAYDNGLVGGRGEVGIWTYSSNDVLMQYNQSYDNGTTDSDDGDGFDFDADTSNSIMQYNIAYGNDGGGFELFQWYNDNDETGDMVRFNISQNNGRKNNYSDIDVWGKVENAKIYNNTCYTSPASNGQSSDVRISNNTITNLFASNIYVANNIFVSTGSTPLVAMYAAAQKGASNIVFAGNVYFSYSGTPKFEWGSTTYTSFGSWQSATGQEKLSGSDTGSYANPQLAAPGQAAAESSAAQISNITAYDLLSDTPIVNVGVTLNTLFTVATPLTGEVNSKTIPGYDQHLGAPSGSAVGGPATSGTTSNSTATASLSSTILTGWDIGSPNKGSNSESGNTDTVTGGGSGITGTSDSFRYAWTTLSGNGQISAQITNMSNGGSSAGAGLMIRSTNTANSPQISLLLSPGDKTAKVVWRSTTGATSDSISINDDGDQYVKLVRVGNLYSGYISANGVAWTLVDSVTLAFGATNYIGLASTAGAMGSTETAVFENVTPSAS